jgi:hypothetical protein
MCLHEKLKFVKIGHHIFAQCIECRAYLDEDDSVCLDEFVIVRKTDAPFIHLQPHPSCGEYGEMIDLFDEQATLPYTSVHIDLFHSSNDGIYQSLWKRKENLKVYLVVSDE